MKNRKWLKRILWILIIGFILINALAAMHAYRFTHFTDSGVERTKPEDLGIGDKVKALIFGVPNPRPVTKHKPDVPFDSIKIGRTACWLIKAENYQGTVIMFHGYASEKSSMLGKAKIFNELGYSVLLVDFPGSGESEGNTTTIGFEESQDVSNAYLYIEKFTNKPIYLFGTSMGAVAILKAKHESGIKPKGVILECPFATMKETVDARFEMMNLPSFPMAHFLMFWGGTLNGFNAYSHNPVEYAKEIECPTLILYGEKDDRVKRNEVDRILANLKTNEKHLKLYPEAGHENYLIKYKDQWIKDVTSFLTMSNP